jgi:ABC-type phosphate/phosphonate transport system substrate-binding protein
VANKDYPAAAIANSVKTRMIERDVVKADQLDVIYTSQTFPTTGYGTAHNLTPELQEKIREAFFSFDWAGTTLEAEFSKSGEAQFIPITFKETGRSSARSTRRRACPTPASNGYAPRRRAACRPHFDSPGRRQCSSFGA